MIGQSASVYKHQTKHRRCCLHYGFRKFICNVKVLTFKRKISKFLFQNKISKYISSVKAAYRQVDVSTMHNYAF